MDNLTPFRRRRTNVREMHDHALDHLQYIRKTMAGAGEFTAVPGWGQVAVGLTALVAAVFAYGKTQGAWLNIWLVEAVVASLIGGWSVDRKARRAQEPLWLGPGKRILVCFLAMYGIAALLTIRFVALGDFAALPGTWLALHGAALLTAGTYSVRPVPISGAAFLALGGLAWFLPEAWAHAAMAAGFGGLHLVFGYWIARKYGG